MMRIISYTISVILMIGLVIVAVANRQPVILNLVPEGLSELLPYAYEVSVPLFIVILLGVMVGLLIGFVWEYIREFRERAAAKRTEREVKRLRREVQRLRAELGEEQDDILALIE
ncbi:MAG: LapA family protein [Pseudomonadota bacterium]